jgi:hypothetical protein
MTIIAIYGEAQGVDWPLNMHVTATENRHNAWMPARRDGFEVTTCARLYAAFAKADSLQGLAELRTYANVHTRSKVTRLRLIKEMQLGSQGSNIAPRWPIAHCRLHVEELQSNTYGRDDGPQLREPGILDKYHELRMPARILTRHEVGFKLNQKYHFRQERCSRLPRKQRF